MEDLKNITIPKGTRLEKDFTKSFLSGLKLLGYWSYKITDASLGFKPCDSIIRTKKETYLYEAKTIEGNTFYTSKIRENQWTAMKRFTSLGGKAIVVVFSIKYQKYEVFDFCDILIVGYNEKITIDF